MKWMLNTMVFFSVLCFSTLAIGQGTVRGNVYDKETGEPIAFGTVVVEGSTNGTNTDLDGFFSISNVKVGEATLLVTYIGYDSTFAKVNVKEGGISYVNIKIVAANIQLNTVELSARRAAKTTDVAISKVAVTPQQIKSLPSTGGVADIAQYLPVLPGIVSTGDQGGQLYIRGGSPIQNKILLDGLTIYNPFHSIGFFSVFETEIVRNIDVLTGAFNAENGGRISAVVDIQTREGDKKRLSGVVGVNPFQTKVLLEGPIVPLKETGGSTSFILTGKRSYFDQTSKSLYGYATPESDTLGLPFSFTDFYGKISSVSGNGSKFNLFGFNFNDRVNYQGLADIGWKTTGFGTNFKLIPPSSNIIVGGTFGYSDYKIKLDQNDGKPRNSGISSFTALLDFTYFGNNNQVKYGFDFSGFNTDFVFTNLVGNTITQKNFTTEIAGFLVYKQNIGNLILEPSFRLQYFASQGVMRPEPRFGMKYKATDHIRFKAAGGLYSQNLLSSVNERDVVNLFVGFLAGPEETIFEPGTRTPTDNRIQTSYHGIGGVEFDLGKRIEMNVEGYYKGFTQLINVNRNKLQASDPDYAVETGYARGIDVSLRYDYKKLYVWTTYSLGYVRRNDGEQEYPTLFDRRHNVNFLTTYLFGDKNSWEASLRYNFGSGFPFTQTQGFFGGGNSNDGINTNVTTTNPDLTVLFDDDRNGGRLPNYHRLDVSVKKTIIFTKRSKLEIVASVTNALNRDNIFYFDRVRFERLNQLPVLPSVGINFTF